MDINVKFYNSKKYKPKVTQLQSKISVYSY
jgi:hypothetical protein